MNHDLKYAGLCLATFLWCCSRCAVALTWTKPNTPPDTNNVIALWHLDDAQSGILMTDWGTNGYDLDLNSTNGWATGGSWNAASNTGYLAANTNYYAHTNDFIDVEWTNDLTISLWVRANSTMPDGPYYAFYLGKDQNYGTRSRSSFYVRPGYSSPFRPTMRDKGALLTVGPYADDTWHHVGMVYDYHAAGTDSLVHVYWDDVLQTTYTNNDTSDENLKIWIGRYQDDGSPRVWDGDVDEFFIYSGIISNFSDGYPASSSPPPKPTSMTTVYETEFDSTDVTNDWDAEFMTVYTNAYESDAGRITVNQGWEARGHASLTYAKATNLAHVTVTAKQRCRNGNPYTYTELAARVSNTTNGVFVRVYGSNGNAPVYLYDGNTNSPLDSTAGSGINSEYDFYDVTLAVSNSSVVATISNLSANVTLTGVIVNSLSPGSVRLAATDVNISNELGRAACFYLKVEEPATPAGTVLSIR